MDIIYGNIRGNHFLGNRIVCKIHRKYTVPGSPETRHTTNENQTLALSHPFALGPLRVLGKEMKGVWNTKGEYMNNWKICRKNSDDEHDG